MLKVFVVLFLTKLLSNITLFHSVLSCQDSSTIARPNDVVDFFFVEISKTTSVVVCFTLVADVNPTFYQDTWYTCTL